MSLLKQVYLLLRAVKRFDSDVREYLVEPCRLKGVNPFPDCQSCSGTRLEGCSKRYIPDSGLTRPSFNSVLYNVISEDMKRELRSRK